MAARERPFCCASLSVLIPRARRRLHAALESAGVLWIFTVGAPGRRLGEALSLAPAGCARRPARRSADRGDGVLDPADQPRHPRHEVSRGDVLLRVPAPPRGAPGPVSVRTDVAARAGHHVVPARVRRKGDRAVLDALRGALAPLAAFRLWRIRAPGLSSRAGSSRAALAVAVLPSLLPRAWLGAASPVPLRVPRSSSSPPSRAGAVRRVRRRRVHAARPSPQRLLRSRSDPRCARRPLRARPGPRRRTGGERSRRRTPAGRAGGGSPAGRPRGGGSPLDGHHRRLRGAAVEPPDLAPLARGAGARARRRLFADSGDLRARRGVFADRFRAARAQMGSGGLVPGARRVRVPGGNRGRAPWRALGAFGRRAAAPRLDPAHAGALESRDGLQHGLRLGGPLPCRESSPSFRNRRRIPGRRAPSSATSRCDGGCG